MSYSIYLALDLIGFKVPIYPYNIMNVNQKEYHTHNHNHYYYDPNQRQYDKVSEGTETKEEFPNGLTVTTRHVRRWE